MKLVKHLSLVALLTFSFIGYQAHAIQSYREWKNARIQDTQSKIALLKLQIETRKGEKKNTRDVAQGQDPNLAFNKTKTEARMDTDMQAEKLERLLHQELYSLELAKDLTVSDYFAGYLTKVKNKKTAFSEVAGKLSPEEVAELMSAYANSAFGAHASDIPASATAVSRDSYK